MCNISLKKTLVSTLNYIELVFAWSLAVGFGLVTAVIMRGYQIIVNLLGSSLGGILAVIAVSCVQKAL